MNTELTTRWTDERGHEHAPCSVCGVDCSTHPDAGNPLDECGDCGGVTCPDHRDDTRAARCSRCQKKNRAAVALGRRGGRVTSPAKAAAARENGKRGGRPRRKRSAS